MTPAQKSEAVELLKDKFSQYSNFYLTDTESLNAEQITKLRRACFDKGVEMKVAKNTLIKRALDSIDAERYSGLYDALHGVTALMLSDTPKIPAVIISSFRKESKGDKPFLKAAFVADEIYMGDQHLSMLKDIKTKDELIGEIIGLLQSPISRVVAALQEKAEKFGDEAPTPVAKAEAAPVEEAPKSEEKAQGEDETPATE